MSCLLYKSHLSCDEMFTQKCCLPVAVLQKSSIKIGDFVSVNCGLTECICRVFPLSHPELSVTVDDTVWNYRKSTSGKTDKEIYDISRDFTYVEVSAFDKVEIKIVYQDKLNDFILSLKQHSEVASKLIQNYVVRKDSYIKCAGQELADLFNIDSIMICNVFDGADADTFVHKCGRISRTTSVEVTGIVSFEQSKLFTKFKGFEIGGMKEAVQHLRISMDICKRILVLGPPGCGKSTMIKKFCCDLNCFLLILDGYSDLTLEKCNSYCAQLINSSKVLPLCHSILFIDNIDQMASSNSKLKKTNASSLLAYLIRCLEAHKVLIIAATSHKGLLNLDISCLFETEISLGTLSLKQRTEQLEALLKCFENISVDCNYIAQKTPGFITGDIALLVQTVLLLNDGKNVEDYFPNQICQNITTEDMEKALLTMTPSLLKTSKWSLKVKPIYWSDIGGMKNIKERLQMCIEKPLLNPDIFKKVDLPAPRGVLLFGPPGCCKTTIARGLATECKANFFAANPSQIYSPYVGESEKNISELFYEARLCSPSIIFLDELDSLVGRRELNSKMVGVAEKVLSTFLTEMDGFGVSTTYGGCENSQTFLSCYGSGDMEGTTGRLDEQVIVVAATNRPDLIDDALLRPGRFDMILYVPPPNAEERESILKTYADELSLLNVDLRKVAEKAEHFSGADLKHLYTVAALNAMRANENFEYITEDDFMEALENVHPSITLQQIQMYELLASKYGTFITK